MSTLPDPPYRKLWFGTFYACLWCGRRYGGPSGAVLCLGEHRAQVTAEVLRELRRRDRRA